jgi:hypothetical protein
LQNRNQEQIDVNTSPDVSQVPIYQNVTKFWTKSTKSVVFGFQKDSIWSHN